MLASDLVCKVETCQAIQDIDESKCSYFEVFQIPESFHIDEKSLDNSFKELQKRLHPDKFASAGLQERNNSAKASASVNQFYQALKLPISRAAYILRKRYNINVLDDTQQLAVDGDLLTHIFTITERVESSSSLQEVKSIESAVADDLRECGDRLQAALAVGEAAAAVRAVMRMKYLTRLRDKAAARSEDMEESRTVLKA